MHGEIGLPFAVAVTRGTAGIGAEPLVAILVHADGEHIFVRQPAGAGESIAHLIGSEINFMHPGGGAHPDGVLLGFHGKRAHINAISHFERLNHARNWATGRFVLSPGYAGAGNTECEKQGKSKDCGAHKFKIGRQTVKRLEFALLGLDMHQFRVRT